MAAQGMLPSNTIMTTHLIPGMLKLLQYEDPWMHS